MNHIERVLIGAIGVIYLPTFGLYHLMIFRVNQHLPIGEMVPHSMAKGFGKRLATEYRKLYSHSGLYTFTLSLTVALFALAVGLVALRIYDYWQFPGIAY